MSVQTICRFIRSTGRVSPDAPGISREDDRSREALMAGRQQFNHQVRRTAITTVAFAAGLVFGAVLLASGDWIPGGIIVAATIAGLAVQIPVIRRLCSTEPPRVPPKSKPAR
jgi:hypothetical protein